jgi:hypothetical protein
MHMKYAPTAHNEIAEKVILENKDVKIYTLYDV